MTELERVITIVSLVNAAIFYSLAIIIFLITRKTRLNKALALQKFWWLLIIVFVALPSYWYELPYEPASSTWRMLFWSSLSVTTWVVLYYVYRANWDGTFRDFLKFVACEVKRLPARMLRKGPATC